MSGNAPSRDTPSPLRRLWRRAQNAFARLAGPDVDRAPHQGVGRRGEDEALRYLRRDGYRLIERNFLCHVGEIDLIVFREGVLVFVEVRTRTEPVMVDALETVTRAKRDRVVRAAQWYARLRHLEDEDILMRFDVVAVRYRADGSLAHVEHAEDAFTA